MKVTGLSDSNVMLPSIDLEDKNIGKLSYSYSDFTFMTHGGNSPYILELGHE